MTVSQRRWPHGSRPSREQLRLPRDCVCATSPSGGGPDERWRTRGTMNAKTLAIRETEIDRRWFVVDATDQTLGRLASRIARVLEGKHKPHYTPNLDSGDHV